MKGFRVLGCRIYDFGRFAFELQDLGLRVYQRVRLLGTAEGNGTPTLSG